MFLAFAFCIFAAIAFLEFVKAALNFLHLADTVYSLEFRGLDSTRWKTGHGTSYIKCEENSWSFLSYKHEILTATENGFPHQSLLFGSKVTINVSSHQNL